MIKIVIILFGVIFLMRRVVLMDYNKAIEIAPNVYWVGANVKEAFFRTNAYLIKGKNESVLVDPGSISQFEIVRNKVLSLVPKEQVKYMIASHQDPDVCSAIVPFKQDGFKFTTISHSRVTALLVFYDKELNFYNIDEHNFKLKWDGDKELQFIFTPYFHSPGAFATYYPDKKILFSSDIFGAFQKNWNLFADEKYADAMKSFNELYAPSKEIVNFSVKKFREKEVEMIAPQHGSVIKKEYIEMMYSALENMKAGMFLENGEINVLKMETTNEIPPDVLTDILNIIKKRASTIIGEESLNKIINEVVSNNEGELTYDRLLQIIEDIKQRNSFAIAVVKVPLVNYVMDNTEKFKGKVPSLIKDIIYM